METSHVKINEKSIQSLFKTVEGLKKQNEELIIKMNNLEKKNEILSNEINELETELSILEDNISIQEEDNISMQEMSEYVEEKINDISPLKEGWNAIYSHKAKRMGYFYDRDHKLTEPPPTYLYWDRTEYTKKQVICVSDE